MSEDSSVNSLVLGFVAIILILAFLAPQYINLIVNLFAYLLVDHIEGMIAGALVGAFLGSLVDTDVEVGIGGMVFTISAGAIFGAIVQILLFH